MNINLSQYSLIIICLCGIVFCFAAVFIINIMNSKSILTKEEDFVTKYINQKKKYLASNKSGITIEVYVILSFFFVLVGGLLGFSISGNPYITIIAAIIFFFIPDLFIKIKSQKNNEGFEEKYAKSLRSMAASLRAGLSIPQAIEELCTSPFIDAGLKKQYRQLNSSLKMGVSISDAFFEFAEAVQSEDAFDVASAISIQAEIGGNEAFVIEQVVTNISQRIENRAEVKSLLMDSTLMIRVFSIAPFAMLLVLYFMMPTTITYYFSSIKNMIVFAIIILVMIFAIVIANGMKKKAFKQK